MQGSQRHVYNTRDGRKWVIKDGLIYGADPEVAQWTNDRQGGGLVEQIFLAIGLLEDGWMPQDINEDTLPQILKAGVFFWGHQSDDGVSDIYVTVSADDISVAKPATIRAVLNYPFGQLKVRRISAEVDLSNERAVRQVQKLGFKMEGRKRRMAAGGGDVGTFGLLPEECPIWNMSNESTQAAPNA